MSLRLSKCHIVGNLMSRLILFVVKPGIMESHLILTTSEGSGELVDQHSLDRAFTALSLSLSLTHTHARTHAHLSIMLHNKTLKEPNSPTVASPSGDPCPSGVL